MTNTTALLPCPFCGSANVGVSTGQWGEEGTRDWLECRGCGTQQRPYDEDDADGWSKMITAWNTRTPAMRKLDPALAIPNDEGMRERLLLVRNSLGDLKRGFAKNVDPARWVEQVVAKLDKALAETPSPVALQKMRVGLEAILLRRGVGDINKLSRRAANEIIFDVERMALEALAVEG